MATGQASESYWPQCKHCDCTIDDAACIHILFRLEHFGVILHSGMSALHSPPPLLRLSSISDQMAFSTAPSGDLYDLAYNH